MQRLPLPQYLDLIRGGQVLARDTHGEKVIRTSDDLFVKLFRHKRLFSSSRLFPYAKRFASNARMLARLGIPTVEVENVFSVPGIRRDIALYRPLKGKTLRDLARETPEAMPYVLPRLARCLALLHERGILFRSIHFGNVIVTPEGVGLIDVADIRRRPFGSLSIGQRLRNFGHMLRYAKDRQILLDYGIDRFLQHYAAAASVSPAQLARLAKPLQNLAEHSGA